MGTKTKYSYKKLIVLGQINNKIKPLSMRD